MRIIQHLLQAKNAIDRALPRLKSDHMLLSEYNACMWRLHMVHCGCLMQGIWCSTSHQQLLTHDHMQYECLHTTRHSQLQVPRAASSHLRADLVTSMSGVH